MSRCDHFYLIEETYQYWSPVGAATKPILTCRECGHQLAGAALKGHWSPEQLSWRPEPSGKTGILGRHRHDFRTAGYDSYDAIGGARTRVLQRCSCGKRRVFAVKGHRHGQPTLS